MVEEHQDEAHANRSLSESSVGSELGGHEQLKTVLIDQEEHDIDGEQVEVKETNTIVAQSGGDGNS
jgi:hypothetical protein